MTRDERQALCEQAFVDAKAVGTLECAPAFGKTRVACNIITRMRKKNPALSVLVIVPREYLQNQWIEVLTAAGLIKGTEVRIVNSAVKIAWNVDLLICDEIHRLAAPTFAQIFDVVKYKWILGLTGTIKRLDKKHTILTAKCPIIDRVTPLEARSNGWTADYVEFNLGINLTISDLVRYQKTEEEYESYMNRFMWDFGKMKNCAMSFKPVMEFVPGIGVTHGDSACVKLAKEYGWTGRSAADAQKAFVARESNPWGGHLTDDYHPKKLYIWAINGLRSIRKIKGFIQNHPIKAAMAIEICKTIPVKTITFGETIKSADELTKALLPDAVSYHSGVKGKAGASKKKTLQTIADDVKAGKFRIINTAKALDEGADFPEVQMGIRIAGSSSTVQHTQRRGRIVRKHGTKKAVMINLYLAGTKEEQWLTKSQGRHADVIWVESIEEILEQLTF